MPAVPLLPEAEYRLALILAHSRRFLSRAALDVFARLPVSDVEAAPDGGFAANPGGGAAAEVGAYAGNPGGGLPGITFGGGERISPHEWLAILISRAPFQVHKSTTGHTGGYAKSSHLHVLWFVV